MLADRYEQGVLKLDPVFQRQSVWSMAHRTHLLDSIFQGYPIPAIFLYRHVYDTGKTLFEVVDGKPEPVDWKKLCKLKQQSRVEENIYFR